ncbi:hypothetical protein FA95DRAFT_1556869 [Auriscalpium vulgare]|uniref:Uncharacterized protein n=1 Tax=Auriscalpium vulgare TaxID=40419 RepID=A0ACB8S0J9_9AGAM|nr:hypothetical protein FA95DRAFT_1556869 [Auriscalpium vulgare]
MASKVSAADFNAFNVSLQAAALKSTKHSAGLPTDLAFHRSVDRAVASDLDACSDKVLSLANRLLQLTKTAESSKKASAKAKAKLEDRDDLLDRFESLIVESMDQLLERADICLDQYTGRTKAPAIAVHPPQPAAKKPIVSNGRLDPSLQHAHYLPKPQLKFKKKVNNENGLVWYPSLRHKYNAQVPLGHNLHSDGIDSAEKALPPHPYRHEITNLSYPAHMFQFSPPIGYRSFAETPYTWVSTSANLASMLEQLRKAQEIAIDLEYHSYRTYGGFVCLMQISTREGDWIVDTLELREELEDLNEVFTDSKIVKVLHGAESDIVWLQQDFNLYIVNLFDTFHASKVLDFPRHGLATLLEMYCDFTADKKYQLADWRIRPLPEEMLHYARSDTHFLLYIYDNLRNALLDRDVSRAQSRAQSPAAASRPATPLASDSFIREVLARSAETSLRMYEREFYDVEGGSGPTGWDTMARKWNKAALTADGHGGMKREVYKAVHAWRDRIAREEDESTRYVLSNHFVFQLAEQPPADMAALMMTFQSVPAIIRKRANELLHVVRDAVKRGLAQEPQQTARGVAVSLPQARPSDVPSQDSMDVDSVPPTTGTGSQASSLWSRDATAGASLSTSLSVLFGIAGAATTPRPVSSYSVAQSSLFGTPMAVSSSARSLPGRFQDVVNKIHGALVIAPTAPVTSGTSVSTTAEARIVMTTAAAVEGSVQDEIPFVPASQRRSAKVQTEDDTIVVVGQARQKKRKRKQKADAVDDSALGSRPATPAPGEPAASGQNVGQPKAAQIEEDVLPFDFASAPNILDDEPVEDEKKPKKKQKKARGGVLEYGNFPAPPRDRSQVKSGNQSHTFRN